MENRNDNDWIEVIREKYLLDAGAPPAAGWDAINRRLHRPVWLRRTAIAASVLLPIAVGLLIWSPWHKTLPSSEDIIAVSETTAPSTPPSKDNIINPTDAAPTVSAASRPVVLQSTHKGAQVILPGESEQALTSDNLPQESQPPQPAGSHTATFDRTTRHPQLPSEQKKAEQPSSGQQTDEPSAPVQPTFRQSLDDPFADLLADAEPEQQKKHRISVSLGAGTKPVQQDKGIPAQAAPYFAGLTYLNCAPGETPSVKSSVSNTSKYYYHYMASNYGQLPVSPTEIGQYHHDFPITAGLQVRLELLPWLGIGSGVEYSYLHSVASSIMANVDQRLHFIGIPLRFDARLWSNHHWEVYAGLGGKAEKCISASYGNLKCEEPRLQWSAEAFGGIQYRIWNNTSLYLQPELSWYFTQTDLVTYRTEHPFGVSLNAGLRFDF